MRSVPYISYDTPPSYGIHYPRDSEYEIFIGQRHRLRCYFGYRSRNTVISFVPVRITQYRVSLIARSANGEKKRARARTIANGR